ncbi:MAG: ribose 5-phosphate isomerase B [Candidatus Omnitrophica bacterium]|nr:ribose 5-phosphate isomerase B [Candidatus Omnitrophota bacterium]
MKVALGADHGGFQLKEKLKGALQKNGYQFKDFGPFSEESTDYPDFGYRVAKDVSEGIFERGILVCTTGIGMSIVANKVRGIRAALCYNLESARCSREHNNANVLVLAGKFLDFPEAVEIVEIWLKTDFSMAERHVRRVNKIKEIEEMK